ncbi:choice-of-anchor H family protein [Psychrobium sp. 1_MG-2023]|uniref:choice-of-anchor H family protein n=1 Tax=Psychrobium sp. 1_MG-2023 TaxID=3062624 RepID=UPI000C340461|nr:choice-of-anchor H family protein [Psychrobium sp. 1_MG-2023]MDP2559922.1 choice-of-anchor H family protein [Psychrobium sp. 1_MG-2023]PKF58977.1 hypothetical protein CW748_01970 [Alteromonadales bacterium alter-6D02]
MKYIFILVCYLISLSTLAATELKQSSPMAKANASLKRSHNDHQDFWLYALKSTTAIDEDSDRYMQQLSLTMDFDSHFISVGVYAKIWATDSYNDEVLLATSDVFTLREDSNLDTQQLVMTVDNHLASDDYQVTIVLHDAITHRSLITASYDDYFQLADLPLEGHHYDHYQSFYIYDQSINLTNDDDSDSFYTDFEVALDVDTTQPQLWLTAQVMVDGVEHFQTRPFLIKGESTADTQYISMSLEDHSHERYRTVEVRVSEANSSSHKHRVSAIFTDVNLESTQSDQYHSHTSTSHHGGATILFPLIVFFSILLKVLLKLNQRKRMLNQ